MRHITASVVYTALAFLSVAPAQAETECRSVDTVTNSVAGWKENLDMTGHIHMHIKQRRTERGKTQFASEDALKAAFKAWQGVYLDPKKTFRAKTCHLKDGGLDCVLASDVGVTEGFRCTSLKQPEEKLNSQQRAALEKAEGKGEYCATWDHITPTTVAFNYIRSTDKKKWILNTAYPSEDANCH